MAPLRHIHAQACVLTAMLFLVASCGYSGPKYDRYGIPLGPISYHYVEKNLPRILSATLSGSGHLKNEHGIQGRYTQDRGQAGRAPAPARPYCHPPDCLTIRHYRHGHLQSPAGIPSRSSVISD